MKWDGYSTGIFKLSDIAAGTISPPPPLFAGLVLDNTLTMIAAPPYVGKSLLLGAMAISLDSGLPLLGRFAPADDKRVLMIAQDAPTWDYAGQFSKLVRGYGLTKEAASLLETNLIINRGIQITDRDFMLNLQKAKEETDFNVLILDAFWTIHGLNENDQSQMGIIMTRLKKIREDFGCAIIFAHHDRKPVAGVEGMNVNYKSRGSSVIPASVDFNMALHRTGKRIRIQMGKGRGEDELGLVYYDLKDVEHADGPALKLEGVNINETRQGEILAIIKEPKRRIDIVEELKKLHPELTTAQAQKAVDYDIRLLRSVRKVDQVRHGVWAAL